MRKSNVNSLIRQSLALKFFKNYHNYKEKKKEENNYHKYTYTYNFITNNIILYILIIIKLS